MSKPLYPVPTCSESGASIPCEELQTVQVVKGLTGTSTLDNCLRELRGTRYSFVMERPDGFAQFDGSVSKPIELPELQVNTRKSARTLVTLTAAKKLQGWRPPNDIGTGNVVMKNGSFEILPMDSIGNLSIKEADLTFVDDIDIQFGLQEFRNCEGDTSYRLVAKRITVTPPTCDPAPPSESSSSTSPSSTSSSSP